jgi:hypothetical protein
MKLIMAFYCLCMCVSFINSNAQTFKFDDCDSGNFSVLRRYKGNVVNVDCDTIYLMNKFTFNLMYTAYNDFRAQNLLLSRYTSLNDSISNIYQAQLDTQQLYFDSLKTYFDTLSNHADSLAKKSTSNLDSIARNLDSIQLQIRTAKENITHAQHEIKEEKKQKRRDKLKWSAIGFSAGAILTFIVTVISLH